MSDLFLSLSRNTLARSMVQRAGIPIPLPQNLNRQRAPWQHETLQGFHVGLGGQDENSGLGDLAGILVDAGAIVAAPYASLDGLLYDASNLTTPEDLDLVYHFFHERIGQLKPCSHILLITRSHHLDALSTATQEALTGFVRSLAKELGGRGITVNMITLEATVSLGGVVRFFLSHHGSFITGQVLTASGRQSASLRYDKLLEGQSILVTGAAQGIGAAIARRAAAEGAKVLLLDRPQQMTALETLAREVHGTILPIDLLKEDAVMQTIKRLRELAPIHGVVHNAGITCDKTLRNMTHEKWSSVMRLNLEVPLTMTEHMMAKDHDFVCAKNTAFVYLSSVGGIAGNPGQTNYAATKAGLIGYARSKAELGRDHDMRFNCVAPGFIATRMTDGMPMAIREVARRFNSLKQAGEPDDVAQAVVFLLSDASSSLNGQTLRVCGQNLIGR
jgi:3-oxoacyl-[acyl-carrier protein] reductase